MIFRFDFIEYTNTPSIYLEGVVTTLLPPFMLLLFSLLFIALKNVFKLNEITFKDCFMVILIISIYSFQSTILNSLSEILDCIKIDNDQFYISSYLLENCNSSRYLTWFYFFILPIMTIYTFIFPASAFFYIKYRKKHLYYNKLKAFGFLTNGYKKSKFYWYFMIYDSLKSRFFREVCYYFRKLIIILIVSYFQLDIMLKSITIIFILNISILIHYKNQPFLTKNLNSLEENALLSILLVLFSQTFAYLATNTGYDYICVIMILFTNIQFIVIAFRFLLLFRVAKIRKYKLIKKIGHIFPSIIINGEI